MTTGTPRTRTRTGRRSRAAALLLAGGTVVALLGGCADDAGSPAAAPPPPAAAPPSPAAPPIPAAPPTTGPPASGLPTDGVSNDSPGADRTFLGLLDAAEVDPFGQSDEYVVEIGRSLCGGWNAGASPEALVRDIQLQLPISELQDTAFFLVAATGAYCPEFSSRLRSPAGG